MTNISNGGLIAASFVGGFFAAIVLLAVISLLFLRSSDAYGLGHWKLNVKMPLATMWMNLGYWANEKGDPVTDFEEACSNLLKEILRAAKLLPHLNDKIKSFAVLDLGFGCGDQIVELVRLTQPAQGWTGESFRYVGLSLNQSQVGTASRRISQLLSSSSSSLINSNDNKLQMDSFHLFRANAARPDSWTETTSKAVSSLTDDMFRDGEKWLLALDCLYHFSPSRVPVFIYTCKTLDANIMAFDLLLDPASSFKDRLLLKGVAFMMNCPLATFLTEEQYLAQLETCGYERSGVELRDVTDFVFSGVSDFIERQERALGAYAISLGGFKLAGRLFRWFDRSRVVKAMIVVARKNN